VLIEIRGGNRVWTKTWVKLLGGPKHGETKRASQSRESGKRENMRELTLPHTIGLEHEQLVILQSGGTIFSGEEKKLSSFPKTLIGQKER